MTLDWLRERVSVHCTCRLEKPCSHERDWWQKAAMARVCEAAAALMKAQAYGRHHTWAELQDVQHALRDALADLERANENP